MIYSQIVYYQKTFFCLCALHAAQIAGRAQKRGIARHFDEDYVTYGALLLVGHC
jgi:hypothetical protein